MLNNYIIIKYDPFVMESRVSVYTEQGEKEMQVHSTIREIAEAATSLAYDNNCYEIRVHAPSAIAQEIKNIIQACEQLIYSKNKINVEEI